MQIVEHHTATEAALEEEGVHLTQHYALRADQLEDGMYRYALENPDTGEILAEAMDVNPDRAIRQFEEKLRTCCGLSGEEVAHLIRAIDHYEEA